MTFGATITFGDDNTPLPPEVARWLTEVRVEEELSKPTKFAIRFEDDLCGDSPAVEGRPEIAPNTMMSVLVPDGNKTACLVRGRVTTIKTSSEVGGPGSFVETYCEERVEMDRTTVQANWIGPEEGIVASILLGYGYVPDISDLQNKIYTDKEQLNQRGTDFALLDKIAKENGVDFWISYDVTPPLPFPPGAGYGIIETAHFRISPEQPDDTGFDLAEFPLKPEDATAPKLRINVPEDQCSNVITFRASVDTERPNAASGTAIDAESGETRETQTTADPSTTGDGRTLDGIDGVSRTIITSGPGDETDQSRRDSAALREASWFVSATVTTSAHLLTGRVLRSHQIVNVEGAGPRYSIPFQARKVTHVINAATHVMESELRSNILGEGA